MSFDRWSQFPIFLRHDTKPPQRPEAATRAVETVREQSEARFKAELRAKQFVHACWRCVEWLVGVTALVFVGPGVCRELVERYNKEIHDRTLAIEKEEIERIRQVREAQARQNKV
jgi:hypothetical protein